LFVAQGYVATTVDEIARRAEVSKPTVFASVGNKRVILVEVRKRAIVGDDDPVPLAQRPWFREALTEPDAVHSLHLHAGNVVRLHGQAGDINEVLRTGAGADAELREVWLTAEKERRTDAATFIDALIGKTRLKGGLDRDSAVDLMWVFTSADAYQRLVTMRRWSLSQYGRWLADTFVDQFLDDATLSSA
jgi:AcrR family transcriptional regulator